MRSLFENASYNLIIITTITYSTIENIGTCRMNQKKPHRYFKCRLCFSQQFVITIL